MSYNIDGEFDWPQQIQNRLVELQRPSSAVEFFYGNFAAEKGFLMLSDKQGREKYWKVTVASIFENSLVDWNNSVSYNMKEILVYSARFPNRCAGISLAVFLFFRRRK